MSNVKKICVVDCAEKLAEFRHRYNLDDEALSSVLVAGCTHELSGVYVDPIFNTDVRVDSVAGSRMARSIKELIHINTASSISDAMHHAGDHEVADIDFRIMGNIVVIEIGLREEDC